MLDPPPQPSGVQGLAERARAEVVGLVDGPALDVARHDQRGGVREERLRQREQLEPVPVAETQIEEESGPGPPETEELPGLRGAPGHDDLTVLAQQPRVDLPRVDLVVDGEKARAAQVAIEGLHAGSGFLGRDLPAV